MNARPSIEMAQHDRIKGECEAKINELLFQGESINRIARIVGVSPKSVAVRRARLVKSGAEFPDCRCGKPVGHRGTCSYTIQVFVKAPKPPRSPIARSHVHDDKKKPGLPPGLTAKQTVDAVRRMVPRGLTRSDREEIAQEILLKIYSGELSAGDVGNAMAKVIRDHFKTFEMFGAPISLDSCRKGERSMLARIPDDKYGVDVHSSSDFYISTLEAARSYRRAGFGMEEWDDE